MNTNFMLNEFLNGHAAAFDLLARNTVTGERRSVTIYAQDATAAYGKALASLDAESGNRAWIIDDHTRREA